MINSIVIIIGVLFFFSEILQQINACVCYNWNNSETQYEKKLWDMKYEMNQL